MRLARLAVATLALALTGAAPAGRPGGALTPVRFDHHMHVHSPAILAFLPGYCASPGRVGKCDPAFTAPLTPDDLLRAMDKAGIRRGLLMSTAYLAESPMMVPARADHAELLRAANDWTVALARSHPDRFTAFVGVDPITPTAIPEIARWAGAAGVGGIKLHLTNSGVDLRDPGQRRQLAAVFHAAHVARLPIMVHMRTRAPDYGAADVRLFLADILPAAGDTPVQIAHAAGWGGVDRNTLDALGAFADALDRDPRLGKHLWFDLAEVWKDTTSDADKAALVALIRRIGPKHFLPASDWPFAGDLADYYGHSYPALPLAAAEWRVIRGNVAPYAGGR